MKKLNLSIATFCIATISLFAQAPCSTNLTSAIGTDSQEVCNNSAISDISYQVSGTDATVNGLPRFISGTYNNNTFTIGGTPNEVFSISGVNDPNYHGGGTSYTYTYTITTTGGCLTDSSITGSIKISTVGNSDFTNYQKTNYCKNVDQNPIPTYLPPPAPNDPNNSDAPTPSSVNNSPIAKTAYFEDSGNVVFVDSMSGEIDLTNTPMGDYVIKHTYAANGSCAENIISENIHISDGESPVTVNSKTICAGNTATLTANGASSYSWSTGDTINPITVSPVMTTSYTVSSTVCNSSAVATVVIEPVTLAIIDDQTICSGDTTLLIGNISGFEYTYEWLPNGETSLEIFVSPTNTTSYTFTATTQFGCEHISEATVTVNLDTLSVTDQTICAGKSITLTASNCSHSTGNYSWSNGGTTNQITVSPTSTKSYTVTNTNTGDAKVAIVTVSPVPTVTVNSPTICKGETAVLTASGADTFIWSDGSAGSTLTASPIGTATYILTGAVNGCTDSITGTITVIQIPIVVNSAIICEGNSATLTASGAETYTWTGGSTGDVFVVSPLTTTSYTVTGRIASGCTASTISTVKVPYKPKLLIRDSDIQTVCINNSIQDIEYDVFSSYTVNGLPNGITAVYQNNKLTISGTPTVEGSYTYTLAADVGSCDLASTPIGTITVKPLSIGGCDGFIMIRGIVYQDMNNNCMLDTIGDTIVDKTIDNVLLRLYNASNNLIAQTYTQAGAYSFAVWDTAGVYTIVVDSSNLYTSQCSSSNRDTVTITKKSPPITGINFTRICSSIDYGVQSVWPVGRVFPGQRHSLNINAGIMNSWFNVYCPGTTSGTLTVTITGPVTFNSVPSYALTPSIQGNEYTYTIADWATVNMHSDFKLYFDTDTTAQADDEVCVHIELSTANVDENQSNDTYDFCYRVNNSYDPNMKEVYPVDVNPGYEDWFSYTIHFQNTGNANAINIKLKDTLDVNLDLATFEVLGYSHNSVITLFNNVVTVFYPNIELPDSTSNPEGSQGFVQYRIKPIPDLPLGTKIKNTASIYFDYNPPIVTNTTVNEYKTLTSISEKRSTQTIHIFPNPFDDKITVEVETASTISITNVLGSTVYSGSINQGVSSIDTYSLNAGIYFITISNTKGVVTKKMIKN